MEITIYGSVKGRFLEKNVERKDDTFITGEIDSIDTNKAGIDYIIDLKGSWDLRTFFRNIKYLENPKSCPYFPSMQGYMKLWEKQKSRVVYVLADTPEALINKEKKNLLYTFVGTQEMYEEACKELEYAMKFSDIDPKRRIIEIPIERDEKFISLIEPTVIACREYLNNFKEVYYELD